MMSVEQSVEWELAGGTEVIGDNQPQRHFVHHKSHVTWPGTLDNNRSTSPIRTVTKKQNSVAWVRNRTIPTERPPLVGEISANFSG
jgi:hypothetical protein